MRRLYLVLMFLVVGCNNGETPAPYQTPGPPSGPTHYWTESQKSFFLSECVRENPTWQQAQNICQCIVDRLDLLATEDQVKAALADQAAGRSSQLADQIQQSINTCSGQRSAVRAAIINTVKSSSFSLEFLLEAER